MTNIPGTPPGHALGVVVGVSGAAGLALTLLSRIAESPAPLGAFGFGALVAGCLGVGITRRREAIPVPVRLVPRSPRPPAGVPTSERTLLAARRSTPARSTRTAAETRHEGANRIGLTEWLLAPIPLEDQPCDGVD